MENTNTTRTRKTILSILAAGITAAAITVPTITASASPEAETTAAVEAPSYSPDEQAIVDWAFGLYTEAGMDLPSVVITFHDTKEACNGNKGLHTTDADGTSQLNVCDWHEKESLRDAWRRKTVMHELAHAWAHHNLTTEDQEAFASHRNLNGWRPAGSEWQDRGTEHAAEVIAWGLMDTDVRVDARIENSDCSDLAEAFTFLTGGEATNGLTHNCR